MNTQRTAVVLPFAVALLFFVLAFIRPHQRGVWLAIGVAFFVVGIVRRRKAKSPSDKPGA
jgi:hypothetical protein